MTATVEQRIDRLSTVSARRVIEPDESLPGRLGDGQLVADELLSVAGLGLELSERQRIELSREEVAAITSEGIRFEAILMAGFGLLIAWADDLTDPRVTYLLHEVGEETRHSRLFVRVVDQLAPRASNPFERGPYVWSQRRVERWVIRKPAMLCVAVLAGEEIPDLLQKLSCEHPGTDPFLRAVNRYHREEEARHLAFARMLLPELWSRASGVERWVVRHVQPLLVRAMFNKLVHPGVYAAVGLPGWRTWAAVRRSPTRVALRHEATRRIVAQLRDAGTFRGGRVPRAWRRLAGVDRAGRPFAAASV